MSADGGARSRSTPLSSRSCRPRQSTDHLVGGRAEATRDGRGVPAQSYGHLVPGRRRGKRPTSLHGLLGSVVTVRTTGPSVRGCAWTRCACGRRRYRWCGFRRSSASRSLYATTARAARSGIAGSTRRTCRTTRAKSRSGWRGSRPRPRSSATWACMSNPRRVRCTSGSSRWWRATRSPSKPACGLA